MQRACNAGQEIAPHFQRASSFQADGGGIASYKTSHISTIIFDTLL